LTYSLHYTRIVDPDNETTHSTESKPAVDFSNLFNRGDTPPVTPTALATASSTLATRPTIPYIKKPIYIDYGLRLRIAPTTFINRNCSILDTPVADIVIGEKCSIGPGVTIISVGHPVKFEERCEFESGKAGSWGARVVIEDGVWVGAGVTIL
jgi:acetyltransferase-like isoleucine patch superfamily enzyme